MGYVIGIDGGGTKTCCMFLESEQKETGDVRTVMGKGTNPHVHGFKETAGRLQELIQRGLEKFSIPAKEVEGIGIGLAGLGRDKDVKKMHPYIKEIFFNLKLSENCNLYLGSDGEVAWRGALPPDSEEGILVIAGTGSIAIGKDREGELHRTGGWGHLLGDEGSGYYLSLKALSSITKAADGRGPATLLSDVLLKEWQLTNVNELVSYIYSRLPEKQDMARLARCVIEASDEGDLLAANLLLNACEELILHVEGLFNQSAYYHPFTPVTVAGSLFTHSTLLKSSFIKEIDSRGLGKFTEPFASPEYGAAILAASAPNVMKGGRY